MAKASEWHVEFQRQRLAADLTQAELAKLLGVSATAVNIWESGKSIPRSANVDRIRDLFARLASESGTKSLPVDVVAEPKRRGRPPKQESTEVAKDLSSLDIDWSAPIKLRQDTTPTPPLEQMSLAAEIPTELKISLVTSMLWRSRTELSGGVVECDYVAKRWAKTMRARLALINVHTDDGQHVFSISVKEVVAR